MSEWELGSLQTHFFWAKRTENTRVGKGIRGSGELEPARRGGKGSKWRAPSKTGWGPKARHRRQTASFQHIPARDWQPCYFLRVPSWIILISTYWFYTKIGFYWIILGRIACDGAGAAAMPGAPGNGVPATLASNTAFSSVFKLQDSWKIFLFFLKSI